MWLTQFGVLADAWTAGILGEAHIRELKKLDNGRTRRALQRDQQMFVDWLDTLDFNQWEEALGYWLIHADPDGSLDPERDATYGVRTKKLKNGDIDVHAVFDPITGEAFLTALEHEAKKILRRQTEQGLDVEPEAKRSITALLRLITRWFARKDAVVPAAWRPRHLPPFRWRENAFAPGALANKLGATKRRDGRRRGATVDGEGGSDGGTTNSPLAFSRTRRRAPARNV